MYKWNEKILRFLIPVVLLTVESITSKAQDIPQAGYIMLDSLKNNFKVTHYTLHTKELYNIDKTIEIYNVPMRRGEILLTFSVLPRFNQLGSWVKVDVESIKSEILSTSQIGKYAVEIYTSQNIDAESINSLRFKLIKTVGNSYYVSKSCLTQRFNVHNFPFPLRVSLKHNINIEDQPITIREFIQAIPGHYAAVMNPENDHRFLLERELIESNYLSQKIKIGKDTAYQFWTFTDWHVHDWWHLYRGIDRFVYIPDKGIVGGSYDFWFAFKPRRTEYTVKGIPVPREKLWDNIINERVMLAEELKK